MHSILHNYDMIAKNFKISSIMYMKPDVKRLPAIIVFDVDK